MSGDSDTRPWGGYEVLADGPGYQIKRITVLPDERLSLQRHARRDEHWVFLTGQGRVTRGEREIEVQAGSTVDIPRMMLHRIENTGDEPLLLVEVQRGDYLGEDDIERFEDDYGRIDT